MRANPRLRQIAVLLLSAVLGPLQTTADPIVFKSVQATSQGQSPADLNACIDGFEAGASGWSPPSTEVKNKQAAVFVLARKENTQAFKFTLFFLSGQARNAIAEFALAATGDANPTLASNWEPMTVSRFSAENAELGETPDRHLRAGEVEPRDVGIYKDAVYSVTAFTRLHGVTGIRVEAFPVMQVNRHMALSWGLSRTFILTEFRAEAVATTNVALYAHVKASHPLWHDLKPEALTDGFPATIAHPSELGGMGGEFYFEIDLGASYAFDHIGLLSRNVGPDMETERKRFTRMLVRAYEQPPDSGSPPVWEAMDRADGSYPKSGAMDLLNKASGKGVFGGRYLRISSDNAAPLSPQLAEVEVYPVRTPELIHIRADGMALGIAPTIIPAGTHRLSMGFRIPQFGVCANQQFRWRFRGYDDAWSPAYTMEIDIASPLPGSYVFEAQAAHSDGNWDSTVLSLPVTVRFPFTQTTAFRLLIAGAVMSLTALVVIIFNRRHLVELRTNAAVVKERARIARNMHDEIGARLSQLAMIQDVFSRKHSLSEPVRADLGVIAQNTRKAIEALDEVVWTVNPQNDKLASLVDYLVHYAENYFAPTGIACRTNAALDWPDLHLNVQPRQELVFAFKEALQNVVKHSRATLVTICVGIENENLLLQISDNGLGLPETTGGIGKDGLGNIESRLGGIGCKCVFRNRQEGGTEVIMNIPISSVVFK